MRFTPFLIAILTASVHSQDFGVTLLPNRGKSVLIPQSVSPVAAVEVTPCYADIEMKDTAPAPDRRGTVANNIIEESLTIPTTLNGVPVTVAVAEVPLHNGEMQVRDANFVYVTMTEIVIATLSVLASTPSAANTCGPGTQIYRSRTSTKVVPAIIGSSVSISASSTMASYYSHNNSGNVSTVHEITTSYTGPTANVSAPKTSSDLASRSDLTWVASIATSLVSTPGWPSSLTSSIADGGAGFAGATNLVLASNASVVYLPDGFFPFLATYMLTTVVIGVAMVWLLLM